MPCRRPGPASAPGSGRWDLLQGRAVSPRLSAGLSLWRRELRARRAARDRCLSPLRSSGAAHRSPGSPSLSAGGGGRGARGFAMDVQAFGVGTGHQRSQLHPDTALLLPQRCAIAVPGIPGHRRQGEGVGAAGGWRQLVTGMLQPGRSPPAGHGPGWRAGRAGSASRAQAGGRRGCHGLSLPPALLQACRALACGDDGGDDALGLRRKAEKSCHGDGLCHFKEARRHSRPSLPDEPSSGRRGGRAGGDLHPPHVPGALAGPQRWHLTWEPAARLQAGVPAQGVPRGRPPSGPAGSNWWHWDRAMALPAPPQQGMGTARGAEAGTCPPQFFWDGPSAGDGL